MLGPLLRRQCRSRTCAVVITAVVIAVVVLTTIRAGSAVLAPSGPPSPLWQPGHSVPIAVADGRARFDVPMPRAGSRALVIVSTLSKRAGPFPIRMTARPTTHPRTPRLARSLPRRAPRLAMPPLPPVPDPVVGLPPRERTFHLMVNDGDIASASNYLAVKGELKAVGYRVQVYVDSQDVGGVGPEVLRDLVTTFDDRVYPTATRTFGQARDVDGDGRFTVLMSSWLTRLAGGRHSVDGFVRGADLDPRYAAPFGNRCDMMYLNTALGPGPYLRTVLAHEYTHAVTFSAKVLDGPGGPRSGLDEEGWLDEALAHLAEDLHGFSRANLGYRVSAFLSRPEWYRLVVEDYYRDDLFRSHGNRGGTYLFLRWCADRYGPGLLPALIRSDRRGTANLEAATGIPFADLYREWSVALFLSGLDPKDNPEHDYRSLDVRGRFDEWELAGPRAARLTPGDAADTWTATGTSSHFAVIESVAAGAVEVEVSGPAEADLQVTAVPLPEDMARLDLKVRAVPGPNGELVLRAQMSERQGTPVRLSALAWEPLTPAADPRAAGFRRCGLDMLGIASAFGTSALPGGGTLESRPIRPAGVSPESGPLVVKAVGTDAQGHRVAAWAELDPSPTTGETYSDEELLSP